MAAIAGKKGLVEYAAGKPVLRINSWNMDLDSNMIEVTSWSTGTDTWRSFIAGLNGWSGSFSGFWDMTTASTRQKDIQTNTLTPTTALLVLSLDKDAGANYRGSVLISGISASANIDAVQEVTFNFQGTGALTYSTSTS